MNQIVGTKWLSRIVEKGISDMGSLCILLLTWCVHRSKQPSSEKKPTIPTLLSPTRCSRSA